MSPAALRDMPPSEMQISKVQARFQGAHFSAIANFGNAVFDCLALFGSARFSELCTNFGEASFLDEADFTQAKFSGTANFRLASFGKIGKLLEGGLSCRCQFPGCQIHGLCQLSER